MKGKWTVYRNSSLNWSDGKPRYTVGRIIDTSQPLHGGNIEYRGDPTISRVHAQAVADRLNAIEAEEEVKRNGTV